MESIFVVSKFKLKFVKAEIITIGDEILIGQIVDTNSAWLGTVLNERIEYNGAPFDGGLVLNGTATNTVQVAWRAK